MPTLEEMINQIDVSSRTENEESGGRTIWQRIKGEWPPLIPQPPLLTLEKVWQYVLLEDPTPPNAGDLIAEAAEEDQRYPERTTPYIAGRRERTFERGHKHP